MIVHCTNIFNCLPVFQMNYLC